jgi:hypothetical protein
MQITNKTEIPVTAAGTAPQRITAAPLVEASARPVHGRITDILLNKRVILVMDDKALAQSFCGIHTAIVDNKPWRFKVGPNEDIYDLLLDCQLTITDMSTFVRMLPKLKKDVVVLDNPIDLAPGTGLGTLLEKFRKGNPQAVIVSGVPMGDSSKIAALEVEVLKKDGLIDFVCNSVTPSTEMMKEAALIVGLKVEAAQALLAVGGAEAHCSPDDPNETVLIEPIQDK